MTDTVERMVWMDTIEPGTVLQWLYYDERATISHPEWVTVLAVRIESEWVHAIVVRPNGEQDGITHYRHRPIRVQAAAIPEDVS